MGLTKEEYSLISSIVEIANDYKGGNIISAEHVEKWIEQFDEEHSYVILTEMEAILRKNYISKSDALAFISDILEDEDVVGPGFENNYKKIEFLDIQRKGKSQQEILEIVDELLLSKYDITLDDCGNSPESYVYIDDCFFTGNTLQRDIEKWIDDANPNTTLNLVFMGVHTADLDYRFKKIEEIVSQKNITVQMFWAKDIHNNIKNKEKYDCMWPSVDTIYNEETIEIIDFLDEQRSEAQRTYIPLLRDAKVPRKDKLFTSPSNRKVIEKAFLEKGAYIYSLSKNPSMKPMGYHYSKTLGFGSTFITYRNIANNCPLVLWWGDLNKPFPLNQWYPLFPRGVNE